ncbi:GNAT family N-acetyltransferase [Streptomyces sp. NPDC090306]|uniref:GNAT family N-acetyltransferase n=1 Tax=Streptomyces sp. NPDC090306 TaxID=3365961 RepID=UPI00381F9F1B
MPLLAAPTITAGTLAALGQPVLPMDGGGMLRPWREADAASVVEAYADPHIQRWHVRRADSVAEAREWITLWRRTWQSETAGHWAVTADDGKTVLGRLALKSWDFFDGGAEVAYWTMPSARGAGVAARAVRAAARWALDEAGFQRLELEHSTANPASCRVAAKAGFEGEGLRRQAARHADGWHDMHRHAKVRQPGREHPSPAGSPECEGKGGL